MQCELPPPESIRIGVPGGVNKVAVKVLNQSDHNNLEREVQVLFGLSHKNLVRLLAYCNRDDTEGGDYKGPLLIYEYMEKGSLDHYIFGTIITFFYTPICILNVVTYTYVCVHLIPP